MSLTSTEVREPAVAGTFYPALAGELAERIDALLSAWPAHPPTPKAVIAPHAGLRYSGSVAARAFASLLPDRSLVRRIVLLGPAHRVAARGLVLPASDAMRTPLGDVPIDHDGVAALTLLPQVSVSAAVHAREHSLEIELPFLQRVLERFSIIPLAVGEASAEIVAEVVERLWGGAETRIVVSSDLSHELPYPVARSVDASTANSIERAEPVPPDRACGANALNGLLLAARRRGLRIERLALASSGDTAGGRDAVVGYGAFALFDAPTEASSSAITQQRARAAALATTPPTASASTITSPPPPKTREDSAWAHASPIRRRIEGSLLVRLARRAVEAALGGPAVDEILPASLSEPGAVFVTIRQLDGTLHGCIGSLEADHPLEDAVQRSARLAAFDDPRSRPLLRSELDRVRFEVSVLSPTKPLEATCELDALAQLRPHVDGVVLERGARRGVLLPQVWNQLSEPRMFLAALREKAGLANTPWDDRTSVSTFTVDHFAEPGYREEASA